MKILLAAGPVMLLCFLAGCGREPASQSVPPGSAPPSQPGRVVLPADSPKLLQIRVEAVKAEDVPTDEVEAPGQIEVNPNRVSHVILPVPGRIATVYVKLGDAAAQSQPLLAIESAEADAALSTVLQAEAGVTQAKSALVKAQADYDRASDLFQHNAVAQKEVVSAESALVQARAAVEQAQASLAQAHSRLGILGLKPGQFGQKVVVRAPIAGKVLEMNVVPGEFRNDTTAPVITIADLSTVWVSSDVPESAIRFIRPGERVDIELSAFPEETLHGRVTRIADTVDRQTRTVKVHAELINPEGRFRPEMFGRIRHTEATRWLPVVPPGAIIQSEGQAVVFKELSRGVFEQVPVKPGKPLGSAVPILEGLLPGDRVVVDGVMLLKGA